MAIKSGKSAHRLSATAPMPQPFFASENKSLVISRKENFFSPKLKLPPRPDKYEKEADSIVDGVAHQSLNQTKSTDQQIPTSGETFIESTGPGSIGGKSRIQRQCAENAEEERLQKKTESSKDHPDPDIELQLNSSKGSGSPLSPSTREQMESSFGTDFSRVRIHDDSNSVKMNKSLSAHAFAYGNDIYFNAGTFNTQTSSGKKLLAHELTHTIQQSPAKKTSIQKDDDPNTNKDPDAPTEGGWNPIQVMNSYLDEWESEKEATNEEDTWEPVELSDEGPSAWIGSGAEGQRKALLLKVELIALADDDYRQKIIDQFSGEDVPGEAYLESIKAKFDGVAADEAKSLDYINAHLKLQPAATPENFIDQYIFQSSNAANAFPDFAWDIVKKLITPPASLVSTVNQDMDLGKRFYESSWSQLSTDMFENGLPVSYGDSLNLTYYKLLRSTFIKKLYSIPDKKWMIETFTPHGKPELYSPIVKQSIDSFAYYGASSIHSHLIKRWQEPSVFRWSSFDTVAISSFRKDYPTGLYGLQDFYNFQYQGLAYSLGEIALAILTGWTIGGQSPFKALGLKSAQARYEAPDILNAFIRQASAQFDASITASDAQINQLIQQDKLNKAIDWSFKKGFAGQSINILLDKLDEILIDILKEWAKEKAIKKGVTTFVSIVGGPLGRLASFLYTAYDTYDDIEDITEIATLVDSLVTIINAARNSKSVIDSQRASARLAEATVTIIPVIISLLGSKLLDKVAKGAGTDQPGSYSDAKRTKLIEETAKQNDATKLNHEQVDAEILTALKSPVFRSNDSKYTAIIALPNGHQWRRNQKGIWCRASDRCLLPFANSEFISDLNKKVDASIHNADVFDPDQAIAPGVKTRSIMAAEIGTKYGAEYAIDELGLAPLNLPNPFTKSDFSDTGFDDIMEDGNGNWYIMEYKGGDSTMSPAMGNNPPQMSSAWVRYVIARIRRKGPEWNFIADPIEAKLNAGKLFGYGIATPINEAGIVMPSVTIPGYNRIQFQ